MERYISKTLILLDLRAIGKSICLNAWSLHLYLWAANHNLKTHNFRARKRPDYTRQTTTIDAFMYTCTLSKIWIQWHMDTPVVACCKRRNGARPRPKIQAKMILFATRCKLHRLSRLWAMPCLAVTLRAVSATCAKPRCYSRYKSDSWSVGRFRFLSLRVVFVLRAAEPQKKSNMGSAGNEYIERMEAKKKTCLKTSWLEMWSRRGKQLIPKGMFIQLISKTARRRYGIDL